MSHNILVVDDDQATCNLLKLGLQRGGSTVTVTTEPELALASLAERDFDLVLTDLNMPRIDGVSSTVTECRMRRRPSDRRTTACDLLNPIGLFNWVTFTRAAAAFLRAIDYAPTSSSSSLPRRRAIAFGSFSRDSASNVARTTLW